MAEKIEFYVKGTPKAQPRPRAWARRMGDKVVARMYDDASAEGWKNCVAYHANAHLPETPIAGPVRVDTDFYLARPQYLLKKKCPDGPIPHTAKPDRDNLDKAVLDVLTTLGFFRDDAQVCDGRVRKFYVARDGIPGAHIVIEPIEDDCLSPIQAAASGGLVPPAPLFQSVSTGDPS